MYTDRRNLLTSGALRALLNKHREELISQEHEERLFLRRQQNESLLHISEVNVYNRACHTCGK